MRNLSDWLDSFMEYSSNSEAPAIFRRWCGISAIASALKRNSYLMWHDRIYPNKYIVLVGPPGSRKGTAMSFTASLLRELNVRMTAESITREALIKELCLSTNTETIDNVIYEHASLTIFAQELAVFLGQSNLNLISDLTDWWDCRDTWTYRTKHHGTDEIKGVWVNLIGATTPSILQASLPQDAIGGGLTSRMIFVYASGKEKTVPLPFVTEEELQLRKLLIQDLDKISLLRGMFRIDKKFASRWVEWYSSLTVPLDNIHFHGYIERKPVHTLKLCMILNAARTDSMIIEEQDLERAIAYLDEAESYMPRVFAGYGRIPTADLIPLIMGLIMQRKEISKSDIMKRFLTELTISELDEILRSLEMAGFCKLIIRDGKYYVRHTPEARNPLSHQSAPESDAPQQSEDSNLSETEDK